MNAHNIGRLSIITLCLVWSGRAGASDFKFPQIVENGSKTSFENAVLAKGGKIQKLANGETVIFWDGQKFRIGKRGDGFGAVANSFWPGNVTVTFSFKGTIKSGHVYINGSGPLPEIEIDEHGDGVGSTSLNPNIDIQRIEVRRAKVSVGDSISLKTHTKVECEGEKLLICETK